MKELSSEAIKKVRLSFEWVSSSLFALISFISAALCSAMIVILHLCCCLHTFTGWKERSIDRVVTQTRSILGRYQWTNNALTWKWTFFSAHSSWNYARIIDSLVFYFVLSCVCLHLLRTIFVLKMTYEVLESSRISFRSFSCVVPLSQHNTEMKAIEQQ